MIEKLKWDEQPENAAKEVQNLIDQLVDAVNELQHDNSEKANCQGSVLTMVDNQVTANLPNIDLGELAFLSKENTELKDEIDRLETELDRTHKALDVAVDAIKISNEIVYSAYGSPLKTLTDVLEQITALEQKDK